MSVENGDVRTAGATDFRPARDRLWSAVLDRDEYAAAANVFAMLDAGLTPEDVLLEVIAPVQNQVGREWAANRLTVTQEHAATAINDHLITVIAHHRASKPAIKAGSVTVACADGEWHALPARLLAEVLRMRGWQVDYVGAHVPTSHLIPHLRDTRPDALALSCSIPTRLPTAHAAIISSQAAGMTVLAGGAAFGTDGRFAYQLGADAWAPDAKGAAERLRTGFPSVSAASSRQPAEDLPHLADQEHALVGRSATQLVKGTLAQMVDRFPPMRAYGEVQRRHTGEDVAQIVEYLATALYVDDDALFAEFITWTAGILAARGVPAASLHPALDLLAEQLKDFPRSQRILQAAQSALSLGNGIKSGVAQPSPRVQPLT